MRLSVHLEDWEIAGAVWRSSKSVVVQLSDGEHLGHGEAQGTFYLGETADSILEQVNEIASSIEQGISREALLNAMPPGGARNAIDCALWDLECKQSGKTIWELTGINPKPVTTVFTIGMESTPEAMAKKAAVADSPILKIKLDEQMPYEKLAAIRQTRPDVELVVDANQSWNFELLQEILPKCAALNLTMIEQPLPRGDDHMLEGFDSPILLAADESCLHTGELEVAARRYGMINIKLDKTGGLTEALLLAKSAKSQGVKLMVGNMCGTSLSMAPSFVIAQLCDFVDIDGPLLLKYDHPLGLDYQSGLVNLPDPRLWG